MSPDLTSPPAPDAITTALVSRDPLRRYQAAGTAAAYFAAAQTDALQALVDAHGGNQSAAAREIGVTPQAVRKRLAAREGRSAEAADGQPQQQPALFFRNVDQADGELRMYALAAQDLADRRDQLVLGALAAGLSPEAIWRRTGIAPEVIARLAPAEPITVGVDVDLLLDTLEDTARALHAYVQTLEANPGVDILTQRLWSFAAESFTRNCAPGALAPPAPRREDYATTEEWVEACVGDDSAPQPDPGTPDPLAWESGPDAWIAAQIVMLRRAAAEGTDAPSLDGPERAAAQLAARVQRAVADAYLHLRTHGTVPVLPDPKEWTA
ncbi:helix-turn-helix domain-containing protein [Kitasatospora sp. NPDC004289]